jgi:hypothetical protein
MPIIGGMVDPNRVMEKVPAYGTWQSNRPVSSTYTFTGPTTGTNNVATAPYAVTIPAGTRVVDPIVFTPDSGGGGGTFTPSTVRLTDVDRVGTFTYTLVGTGSKTISVTNDRGLTNPASIVTVIS